MTTFIGKPVTLVGPQLRVGDTAPDFILMANAVKLSQATMRTIKQILFWTFAQSYVCRCSHGPQLSVSRLERSAIEKGKNVEKKI